MVILLLICSCAYIHAHTPALFDRNKTGYTHWPIGCLAYSLSIVYSGCSGSLHELVGKIKGSSGELYL